MTRIVETTGLIVEHYPHANGSPQTVHAGGKAGGRSPALTAALAREEGRIRFITGGEEAVVLDADGNVLLRKRGMGDPDGDGPAVAGMSFGSHEARKFEGNVMTHNHPAGGSAGLSSADVSTAINDKMAEMRAVDADGTVYSLRPGKTTWGPEHTALAAPVYKKHAKDVMGALQEKVWSGEKTPQEAMLVTFDEITRRTAAEMGWQYEVIKP